MNRYLQVGEVLIEHTRAESTHKKAQLEYNEALGHGDVSEIERAEHQLDRARAVQALISTQVVGDPFTDQLQRRLA